MTFQNKAQVASWLTYLNQVSLGTPSEVMGVVTSLITGQPLVLLGLGGLNKTRLLKHAAGLVDAKLYFRQFSSDTTLRSLFGRINPAALAQGRMEVLRGGTLLEGEVLIFDEVFNTGGDVLTGLNLALNEKEYVDEGEGVVYKLPVICSWAATNRLPDLSRPEIEAHYDRYILRFEMQDPDASILRQIIETEGVPERPEALSREDLLALRAAAGQMPFGLSNLIINLRDALQSRGIRVSPRRFTQIREATKGVALVHGDTECRPRHLKWVARHSTWHTPDDRDSAWQAVDDVFGQPLDSRAVRAELELAVESQRTQVRYFREGRIDAEQLKIQTRDHIRRVEGTVANFRSDTLEPEECQLLEALDTQYRATILGLVKALKEER